MDTVEGKIRKVIWHGVGKGSRSGVKFLIAELADGRVIKGEMNDPRYNETYRFVGNLRFDKYNGDHVFFFEHHEELVEQNESGVAQYLARKVDGLGKKKAAALVECFGIDLLRTLQARPELAAQCKAINEKDVESITKWFNENRRVDPVAVAKLLDMFSGHRFPKKLAEQLALDFGSDAPQTIREQPYMLLSYPRMGWATVDPFALAQGYDPAGIDRHRMAIVEAFEQHASNEGHTYATRPEIDSLAFGLLGTRPSGPAWVAAVEKGDIVSHDFEAWYDRECESGVEGEVAVRINALVNPASLFSVPKLAHAERYIARKLADLMAAGRPLPFEPSTTGLNPDQQAAILLFHDNPVSMLLGAPGTGKSYTIARFLHSCVEAGYRNIRFVAPTGKAAKRGDELISQACGGSVSIPCTTVHRALAPQPSDAPLGVPAEAAKIGRGREAYSFGKNEGDPLDVDLLIVDECFPAGTLVDTPVGAMDISELFPGDRILNGWGEDVVLATSKKEINRAIRIKAGGKEIFTSERHPFFTERGLVFAQDLESGDRILKTASLLRWLRQDADQSFALLPEVLRTILQRAVVDADPTAQGETAQRRSKQEERGRPETVAGIRSSGSQGPERKDWQSQADALSRNTQESFRVSPEDQSPSVSERRERNRSNESGSGNTFGSSWVDSPVHRAHKEGQKFRVSDSLQTRPSEPAPEDLRGSRRSLPSASVTEGSRQEENRVLEFARVDCVEVLESIDPRLDRFRDARGKLYFYDLQATRHQSFSVEGLLVHNCSMMDVSLMRSLLAAIKNGSRLIFVGDINQLPSVGPGSVLRDLKESGSIPFVELSRIVRSDGGGRVVRACHALKDGRVPEPGHEISLPTENWVHLERSSSSEIGDTIVALYESIRNNGNYDPYWDVQVISPQIRTDGIGCNTLNERLSALLNPRREGFGQESPGFTPDFRVGDKVVRTRNGVVDLLSPFRHDIDERVDWRWDGKEWSISEIDVVNGDMGTVTAIEIGNKQSFVVVQFRNPDRLCRLPYGEPHISPAFAMTVHKAQGSGFPVVITPVSLVFQWNPRTNTGLNSLENFYTDISRTETILFTVGQQAALEVIARRKTIHCRRTLLAGRLKEAFERMAAGYESTKEEEVTR